MPTQKLVTHLADGRELIYFDDEGSPARTLATPDRRDLPPRPAPATLRNDLLTGEWVSIAQARANRVFYPTDDQDPLAPQSRFAGSEIPDDYDVVVFENKSPSFGPVLPADHALGNAVPVVLSSFGDAVPAYGRCEVVSFSPDSAGSFGTQTATRARTILAALADRTAALSALPGIAQVFPFENRGVEIGVTLPHPHGQIYAYPFVTPRTRTLLGQLDTIGPDLFARILAHEQASERVVLQTEHVTFFVPFAARWPLEVHALPHEHVPDLAALSSEARDDLAVAFLRVLRAIDARFERPSPYIAAWHQAPVHERRDEVRLMLQITSPLRTETKFKYLAGSESAMGAWVNDVTPEASAALLRELIATIPAPQ